MDKKKINVEFKSWHWSCGDGCCDDYGTSLIIDGYLVDDNFDDSIESIEKLLNFLGYAPEIILTSENNDDVYNRDLDLLSFEDGTDEGYDIFFNGGNTNGD